MLAPVSRANGPESPALLGAFFFGRIGRMWQCTCDRCGKKFYAPKEFMKVCPKCVRS